MKAVTIELEKLIKIIERTDDKEILREIDKILVKNDLMRYVPHRLWGKLIKSRGTVDPLPDEIKAIQKDTSTETIPHDEALKELGYDHMERGCSKGP